MSLTEQDAVTFERCMGVGGVAVFPADTVYGLCCEPDTREAVERLYLLKRRRPDKPAAVMFFALDLALEALTEQGPRTRAALRALLPGAVTVLLPNPARRFPLACGVGGDGISTLGVRVPALPPPLAALGAVRWPVLQSSANLSGGPEPRTVDELHPGLRRAVDLVLDGGPLPGTASTVVDLRAFEDDGAWTVVREGAIPAADLERALSGL